MANGLCDHADRCGPAGGVRPADDSISDTGALVIAGPAWAWCGISTLPPRMEHRLLSKPPAPGRPGIQHGSGHSAAGRAFGRNSCESASRMNTPTLVTPEGAEIRLSLCERAERAGALFIDHGDPVGCDGRGF